MEKNVGAASSNLKAWNLSSLLKSIFRNISKSFVSLAAKYASILLSKMQVDFEKDMHNAKMENTSVSMLEACWDFFCYIVPELCDLRCLLTLQVRYREDLTSVFIY